jgi:hypothetical protein
MNIICPPNPCPVRINDTCVFYTGPNLPITGITTNNNLYTSFIKIEAAFKSIQQSVAPAPPQTVYVVPTPGETTFTVPGLAGNTLLLAFRSGLAKGVTTSPTANTLYLQVNNGVVTLPTGDVVDNDELFIFLYR